MDNKQLDYEIEMARLRYEQTSNAIKMASRQFLRQDVQTVAEWEAGRAAYNLAKLADLEADSE